MSLFVLSSSSVLLLLLSIVCMILSMTSSAVVMATHGDGYQLTTSTTPECDKLEEKVSNCFTKRWHKTEGTSKPVDNDLNGCCLLKEVYCSIKSLGQINKCVNGSVDETFDSFMKNCTDKGFTPNADNCLPLKPLSTVADGVCDEYLHCFLVSTATTTTATVAVSIGRLTQLMPVIVVTIVWSVASVV